MTDLRRCLLVGNTRWHWAKQKANSWEFWHTDPDPSRINPLDQSLLSWAAVGHLPKDILWDPAYQIKINDIPLKGMPSWLGIDRALAAWGALKRAKKHALNSSGLLIADAGTILSITRITTDGKFAGGQLVAGLQLQLKAMAEGAKALKHPEIAEMSPEPFPINTDEAMKRGTVQALIGALIEAQRESEMPLWLCGGDAPVLLKELKEGGVNVSHFPNLALEGMVDVQTRIMQTQGH